MRRRTVLAGLGALGAVVAAGLYRFTDIITPHYPRTPYDDVLAQLDDRESARILGAAALRGRPDFDAAWAVARLRQRPRRRRHGQRMRTLPMLLRRRKRQRLPLRRRKKLRLKRLRLRMKLRRLIARQRKHPSSLRLRTSRLNLMRPKVLRRKPAQRTRSPPPLQQLPKRLPLPKHLQTA